MDILEPDIKYRYSIEDVLSCYKTAEEAFIAGDYVSALRLCNLSQNRDIEISGCAYIMAGHTKKGLEILSKIPTLSQRGYLYLAFAHWIEGSEEKSINILDGLINEDSSNIIYDKFKKILTKKNINILLFGHLTSNGVESLLSSTENKYCKFNLYTVGYSKDDDIRIRHDVDIVQTIYSYLPEEEHPDLALIISPYCIFHKNYGDLPIPKVIFMMDHDYFTYNYGGIIKNDIIVVASSMEHFEVSNFFSLPCHVYYTYDMSSAIHNEEREGSATTHYTNQETFSEKSYDIVITGSTFTDFQRQKSQLVFKLLNMPREWKIRVADGFMDKASYFNLLKKTKLTFSSVRFIDLLQQRGVDALNNSCMILYPENSSWPLFFDEKKSLINPYSLNFSTLQYQLENYLTKFTNHDKQEMGKASACSNFEFLFKKAPYRELSQLKYFTFISLFKRDKTDEQKRKQFLQETTGVNGFEYWTRGYFNDSLLSLKNYLSSISPKTEYHYIKLFNLCVYEGGNKTNGSDKTTKEERRIELLYAHQIGREGLKRFPSSLVLRFNVARFYYFTGMTQNALSEFLRITHNASNLTYFELTADIFNFFFPKNILSLAEDDIYFPQLDYMDNVMVKYINPNVSNSLQKPYTEPKNIILSSCHYFLANIYRKQENLQKSLTHLHYALELYPDNYIAQNLMVETLIQTINQHNRKEVLSKVLRYYVSAIRHYPAFIRQNTFAYAFQAAHFLEHTDTAVQLLDSWFLFYKRVIPANGELKFSKVTITTILKYAHSYPHSLIHRFLDKNFISLSANDAESFFLLEEGEEQLIYPFFEHYLHHYANKQEFNKTTILIGKLICTPNLSIKRQIIHSCIHFLIAKNINSSELQEVIEQLKDADFDMTDDEEFNYKFV